MTTPIISAIDNMRSRLKPEWPTHVRAISERALTAMATVAARRAASTDTKTLRAGIARDGGPMLARAMRELATARKRLDADRASVRDKAITHASPKAAQMAAEVREYMRTLSHGERAKLVLGEGADPLAQRAVLEAPGYLSGVASELRGHVETDLLGKTCPAEVALLDETEESLAHAEATVRLASDDMQRAAGFGHPHDFKTWFAKDCTPNAEAIADEAAESKRRADAERDAWQERRLAEITAEVAARDAAA